MQIRRQPALGFQDATARITEIAGALGGSRDSSHRADYEIADPALVNVTLTKTLDATAVDTLVEGAGTAREVLASARPPMTRAQYLPVQRAITRTETYD